MTEVIILLCALQFKHLEMCLVLGQQDNNK